MMEQNLTMLQSSLSSNQPEALLRCPGIIAESLFEATIDTISKSLVPAVKKLITSSFDEVSESILEVLPKMCSTIYQLLQNKAPDYIAQNIMPLITSLPDENEEEVVPLVSDVLASIIEELSQTDFFDKILSYFSSFANDKRKIFRSITAQTIIYVADSIDINSIFESFFSIILALATDQSANIRAQVASIIASYVGTLSDSYSTTKLASYIVILANDTSPLVRKSVIENLLEVSQKIGKYSREITIQPAILHLVDDSNPQIRLMAISRFAAIMSTFENSLDPILIHRYTQFLESSEPNISYAAAFAFSAVANVLGQDRFEEELLPTYNDAMKSSDTRVRRTLAFALHTYAKIFRPSDLCDAARTFLTDMPQVAIGVVSHLSEILPYVDDQESLIFCLMNPTAKYSEWRMRHQVSQQLRLCMKFYEKEPLFGSAYELVEDEVAIVREDATKSYAILMDQDDIDSLQSLADSDSHWNRLCAAKSFRYMKPEISNAFIDILCQLENDSVVSVKGEAMRSRIEINKKANSHS